jgi:hypothetical protein
VQKLKCRNRSEENEEERVKLENNTRLEDVELRLEDVELRLEDVELEGISPRRWEIKLEERRSDLGI